MNNQGLNWLIDRRDRWLKRLQQGWVVPYRYGLLGSVSLLLVGAGVAINQTQLRVLPTPSPAETESILNAHGDADNEAAASLITVTADAVDADAADNADHAAATIDTVGAMAGVTDDSPPALIQVAPLEVARRYLIPLYPVLDTGSMHNYLNHQLAASWAQQQSTESYEAVENLAVGGDVPPPPLPMALQLTIDDVLEMRVALVKGAGEFQVTASTNAVAIAEGHTLDLTPQTPYAVSALGDQVQINGTTLTDTVWLEPIGGYFWLGDRPYRGRLLIINAGGSLYAVNHVLLKDYLYGVVGSEVSPSWPIESIRAQAIAARSYALTYNIRPATDLYDLDDTQGYQAYGGIAKEAESIHEAVNSTAGEFISDQGGIVESLYAASDHIVQTVHGGRGMSQLGALDLAEQGYGYLEILGHYYPGTAIARLDVDAG